MIILIIIISLVFINFLLLKFSCDCGDAQPKTSRKRFKINAPKVWSEQKSESKPVFADK